MRDKVKTFAQLTAGAKRPDGVACPPYKIIILDEADSMTKVTSPARVQSQWCLVNPLPPLQDAQSALRRTMEKSGRSTKFCLICNYVSRIIEPITSRCPGGGGVVTLSLLPGVPSSGSSPWQTASSCPGWSSLWTRWRGTADEGAGGVEVRMNMTPILHQEKVSVSEAGKAAILLTSGGDLR